MSNTIYSEAISLDTVGGMLTSVELEACMMLILERVGDALVISTRRVPMFSTDTLGQDNGWYCV